MTIKDRKPRKDYKVINGFVVQKDITGQRFGKLVAIEPIGMNKKRYTMWKYKCDCGNETIKSSYGVTSGHTSSCGCLQKESLQKYRRKPDGVAAFNSLLINYKNKSKLKRASKTLKFCLTEDEFRSLISSNCFYCGCPPNQKHKVQGGTFILYNGIDRVDSNEDYITSNCVPCCKRCNRAKLDMSKTEFYNWIKKVYGNLFCQE